MQTIMTLVPTETDQRALRKIPAKAIPVFSPHMESSNAYLYGPRSILARLVL